MAIAASLHQYLGREEVGYELIEHARTTNSTRSAQASHVPGARLAKGTVLKDDQGFLIAVVPATCQVDLSVLHRQFKRPLGLATESEVAELFGDCEPGAVPPLGRAYGIDTILDESLLDVGDVYFEAGDHCRLVHVSGADFRKLMADAPHGDISRHGSHGS